MNGRIGLVLDGRYQIVQPLGAGGFGQTYIAQDTRRPGNPVCVVKVLQPARKEPGFLQVARRLFHGEAETLERLGHHDQIPRLLAFFEQDQEFYLVQDLIEGQSLAQELIPGQRWSESQVQSLLSAILYLLAFIHDQGVIHRDIKPDNIIRRHSDQKLVVVDFGSVKQVRNQTLVETTATNLTVAVGTPGYMASEQSQGKPRPSSDLYSLGIIGVQAVTGMLPSQFREDDDGNLIWRDQAAVSDPFAQFLSKMVQPYFKLRYTTAAEALQALHHLDTQISDSLQQSISGASAQAKAATPTPGFPHPSISSIPSSTPAANPSTPTSWQPASSLPPTNGQQDWGEAIDVSIFYGRAEELATLEHWIIQDRCRLIAILGMGGIGKTALSVKLAQCLQNGFEMVIWRSLRNAPSLKALLGELVPFLSQQRQVEPGIRPLLQCLRTSRCLVVLDNMETILQPGQQAGYFRSGYEDYSDLLQVVGESNHQSCLLLTSREKPAAIAMFEGADLPVRSLSIGGSLTTALALIEDQQLSGTEAHKQALCQHYGCSPLALKITASSIQDLFEGNIAQFLAEETIIFNGVRRLLDRQFERLSDLERSIMYWLAIHRDWTSITDLMTDMLPKVARSRLLEALESLCWRSLIEKQAGRYTQQPVVMEYMTSQLIQHISASLLADQATYLAQYPLVQAQAAVSVYETQRSLILQPVIDELLAYFRTPQAIIQHLYGALNQLRGQSAAITGYFCGNLLHFAQYLGVDLRGYDFSEVTVWQANLQGVLLQDTTFVNSDFCHTSFSEILDEVKAVAYSPDGRYLAIADQDCKVRVWSTQTHQQRWVGQEHQNAVLSVVFSPDSQALASASADHTLKLWDVETGTCCQTLIGHQSEVCAVAFSPTQPCLASGSKDSTLKIWDIERGECQQTLTGHQQAVFSVAFHPDGRLLASGSSDQSVKLWQVRDGACKHTLRGHTNWVTSVAFCPHSSLLGSCSSDHTIKLWDYQLGQCYQTLEGHSNWVLSLTFSTDGRQLVSGSGDQTVKLWDVQKGRCVQTLFGHHHGIFAVAFHPSGRLVASGSHDQTVRIWSVETGDCLKILTGYTNRIFAVAASPDGQTIASGSFDQTIRLWDRQQGQLIRTLEGHHSPVYALVFHPQEPILASGGGDHTIKVWQSETGQCLNTLTGHRGWVYALAYSLDGKWLVSGSSDHTVKVWRIATGDCVMTLTGHQTWIWSVAVSPDGRCLASGSGDRTIKIWDAQTGNCLRTLVGHADRVYSVAFSPNSQCLASGSFDHTIKVWEVETGQCRQTLAEHTNGIYTVDFSPNGQTLASGSLDHTIRRWDLATGQCIATYLGHSNEVRSLTFLPPPSSLEDAPLQIASGSQDQTLRIWNADTQACQLVLKVKPLYDGMNITGATGLTAAQKASLKMLGAVEQFGENI